jgi:DNA polymerase-3 subunit beta
MKITVQHDTIKALLLIAPKADIRSYLNGVCVDARANGDVVLVATDGHRLLAVPLPVDSIESCAPGQYIIPRDTLDAVKPCKAGKHSLPLTIEIVDARITITGATTATSPTIDGRFPDWRRVMPKSANNEPAQFNSDYFASFGKVAALLGASTKTGVTAVIHHNGTGAALVTFPASEALGGIMPCRVDAAAGSVVQHPGLPTWAQMSPDAA